jgi:hypothetical protein
MLWLKPFYEAIRLPMLKRRGHRSPAPEACFEEQSYPPIERPFAVDWAAGGPDVIARGAAD